MAKERRSWEFAAIPITVVLLGFLGLLMWGFTQGTAAWVAIGVVALVAGVGVSLVVAARPNRSIPDEPTLPAGAAPHSDDGVRRLLLIADDDCAPRDLGAAFGARTGMTEAFVVAPTLGSRTARWTSDEHAYQAAEQHLEATLASLRDLGVPAAGHVGSHDPLQAADDGLREFPADEIVFAVHRADERNWLEAGVVEAAKGRYPIPVRDLVLERT